MSKTIQCLLVQVIGLVLFDLLYPHGRAGSFAGRVALLSAGYVSALVYLR